MHARPLKLMDVLLNVRPIKLMDVFLKLMDRNLTIYQIIKHHNVIIGMLISILRQRIEIPRSFLRVF